MMRERDILRTELVELKNCQIRYFALSITSAGLLIGVGSQLLGSRCSGLLFFAPLMILLPSWWIFFDKATTITRIVGYNRVLEGKIIAEHVTNGEYVGWESALRDFRTKIKYGPKKSSLGHPCKNIGVIRAQLRAISGQQTTHRYWLIIWWTFCSLSGLCLALGAVFLGPSGLLVGPAMLFPVAYSAAYTSELLRDLIVGEHSYDENESYWKNRVLRGGAGNAERHKE